MGHASLPGGPVAINQLGLSDPVEDQQGRGDLVDEEAVVGHGDDRAGEMDQGAFHDLDAGEVEWSARYVVDERRPANRIKI